MKDILLLQDYKKRLRDEYVGLGGAPNKVNCNVQHTCWFIAQSTDHNSVYGLL